MRTFKLLSAKQIKEWDRKTMEIQQISSEELMERAGIKLFYTLLKNEKKALKKRPVILFCGVGNNGGDGLVMARLLHRSGYKIKVVIVPFTKHFSHDFNVNLKKVEDLNIALEFFDHKTKINKKSLVIDAIFGTGLNRAAEGIAEKAIRFINEAKKYKVISIDIPSGMYVDRLNNPEDVIVKTDDVYSIELPKRSFFFPENLSYVKKYSLVSIGLEKSILKEFKTDYYTYLLDLEADLQRADTTYKYTFGHAVIIGGSYGMLGAALLAAKAALRAGAGLVTGVFPKSSFIPSQTSIPEVMVKTANKKKYIDTIPPLASTVNAIGIGPGMGRRKKTQKALLDFIAANSTKLVLDADALTILSKNKKYLNFLSKKSILTPHDGELSRLTGKKWSNSLEKIEIARKFAHKHKIILVAKGPFTVITNGKKVFFNPFANGALAKAGTGDVLTGIITGVLAQKQKLFFSALIGVQLHSKAASFFDNKKNNKFSLLASDLIENLKKIR